MCFTPFQRFKIANALSVPNHSITCSVRQRRNNLQRPATAAMGVAASEASSTASSGRGFHKAMPLQGQGRHRPKGYIGGIPSRNRKSQGSATRSKPKRQSTWPIYPADAMLGSSGAVPVRRTPSGTGQACSTFDSDRSLVVPAAGPGNRGSTCVTGGGSGASPPH